MKKIIVLLLMMTMFAAALVAELPDVFGEPLHEVSLEQYFTPDPYQHKMEAGGQMYFDAEEDLSDYFRRDSEFAVAGYVFGSGPDIRFYYDADGQDTLSFGFTAGGDGDTFLLINDPDGDWWVIDDSEDSLDPYFTINNPPGGRYDIWVGTWDSEIVNGTFFISEL
jgi:hypothetical protein